MRTRTTASVVAVLIGLLIVLVAAGATATNSTKRDDRTWLGAPGQAAARFLTSKIVAPPPPAPKRSNDQVVKAASDAPKVRSWLRNHPVTRTTPEFKAEEGNHVVWFVRTTDEGTEVTEAQVWVRDSDGAITEVRTGPQVSWMMARGVEGAFGRGINKPVVWLTLCVAFLVSMVSFRQLVSWRTLDLLALLAFSVSLYWFNRGEIFTSVPLQYPPLVYLLVRMAVIAVRRGRALSGHVPASQSTEPAVHRPAFRGWAPTWLLGTVLTGSLVLRYGLNAFDSNVIDVGYAGVIGAARISSGQTPYGTFPSDCGACDTYGPLAYLVYVPFEWVSPYTGRWDTLGAAHGAAVTFDVLCVLGLGLLGWRLGGLRLAMALAAAWATYPFTAYALASNSNDALVSAVLIWTLVVAADPRARGLLMGLAVATKFGPAILVPLFARGTFPIPRRRERGWRGPINYLLGIFAAVVLVGWVLLLDGLDGARAFWSRTISYQFGRESPFSIWGQYTELRPLQLALTAAVVLAAIAVLRWPRRRDLLVVSALAASLSIATQLTLTHWFYLYIPWFAPFVLLAIVPTWPPARPPAAHPARDPGDGSLDRVQVPETEPEAVTR